MNMTNFPTSRFVSEYGWQSFPSIYSWEEVSSEADWSPQSPLGSLLFFHTPNQLYFFPFICPVDHRQHHPYGTKQIQDEMDKHFRPLKKVPTNKQSFTLWIYLSQVLQTMCIRSQTEFFRRGRGSLLFSLSKFSSFTPKKKTLSTTVELSIGNL